MPPNNTLTTHAKTAPWLSQLAMHAPSTWHHGLVADYWAAVNLDAPELELHREYLRSPILDAGCGAGRLLAPLREEGFDVDGCDASADMLERCRRRAPDATLWVSALHELDPPRRYATIVCSGVLGLGSTRLMESTWKIAAST